MLNGEIYAPNLDGNVYALDLSTGKLLNTFNLGDSISSSPVVIGNYYRRGNFRGILCPVNSKEVNIYMINTI